jgi:nitroreductase
LTTETLSELVGLARICPSAMNEQPLRYILCADPEVNARVFATLAWAGLLKEWDGPQEGERPAGYVVVLSERAMDVSVALDAGIACQSMLLGAVERGLGGCMVGSINRTDLAAILDVPATYEIVLVVALGVPSEKVVLEQTPAGGSTNYYRDAEDCHHVPKRLLEDVILKKF